MLWSKRSINVVFRVELIEDPVNEEKERRRKALEKWTEETHKQFVQR